MSSFVLSVSTDSVLSKLFALSALRGYVACNRKDGSQILSRGNSDALRVMVVSHASQIAAEMPLMFNGVESNADVIEFDACGKLPAGKTPCSLVSLLEDAIVARMLGETYAGIDVVFANCQFDKAARLLNLLWSNLNGIPDEGVTIKPF